jgi:hypothetical protein
MGRAAFLAMMGAAWLGSAVPLSANPALKGYSNYAALADRVEKLAKSELVEVASLGRTLGGREVFVLTIGTAPADEKPAILVVGNVHAPHLVGSELAMRLAEEVASRAEKDAAVKELLARYTIYVLPRPNPDGSERAWKAPFEERDGNDRASDDDRDGRTGEDPADDLDGDGWITSLRVADESGRYMPHPDDPRVLIEADPKKNERGAYLLLAEGRDNDGDGEFNEDASRGTSFNRNFTFRYKYLQSGTGPNAVSEIETRAAADFAFDHPNIAVVFTFTPEDNLFNPWKPAAPQGTIRTNLVPADAPYVSWIAERYRQTVGGENAPSPPSGEGSFSEWAYFHYGRWSLAARGWWVPKFAAPAAGEADDAPKPSGEKRGSDEINDLRWLARKKIDGFVDWRPIEHPDFPGQKVEVGGFKPFYRLNPPAGELAGLAAKHADFVLGLPELLGSVHIRAAKAERLGPGIFRVTADVVNRGYLPTMSDMGRTSRQHQVLQVALELPGGSTYLQGSPRRSIEPLAGGGGNAETTWIVRLPERAAGDDRPIEGKLRAWAPAVGRDEATVELK